MKPYYQEKNITIYHADWREVVPVIEKRSVGMLCTDPPFGTTNLEWDKKVDWKYFWPCVEQLCKVYAVMTMFSSGKFTHDLIATNDRNFRYELIWEKPMPVGFLSANKRPLRAHENILIFTRQYKRSVYHPQFIKGKMHKRGAEGRRAAHYGGHYGCVPTYSNKYHPRSILRFSKGLNNRGLHPTQKPLELMLWLIKSYSNPRHLVLDPFIGSGTTLVAAKMTSRRAIGIDTSEAFCEIAAQRLMKVNHRTNTDRR
jgi:site-specific DNA-methyltransferase (adenine-specific)